MFILVNLKAYETDIRAVAAAAEAIEAEREVRVAIAPQAADLRALADSNAESWAQHISPVEHGSHTGSTLPEAVAVPGRTRQPYREHAP